MTSDECISRERSKREEKRTENNRRKGREENRSEQKKTDQNRREKRIYTEEKM
jgi:hypothetical protein